MSIKALGFTSILLLELGINVYLVFRMNNSSKRWFEKKKKILVQFATTILRGKLWVVENKDK